MKRIIERLSGYWIYKERYLPIGADLRVDLKHIGISPRMVFDVGANVGQSYRRFRRYFPQSRIVSFEPVRNTYTQLLATVGGDPLARAECLALSDYSGTATVSVSDKWSEGNSLSGSGMLDSRTETITVDTLDNYCAGRSISSVDFLKIDTEGFEVPVLRGAVATPIRAVFCEVGFAESNERHTYLPEVMELLRGFSLHGLYDITHSPDYPSHGNALFVHRKG